MVITLLKMPKESLFESFAFSLWKDTLIYEVMAKTNWIRDLPRQYDRFVECGNLERAQGML